MAIRFGTSGRRAVIANDFSFAGGHQVTEAICAHFASSDAPKSVVTGHDSRFLRERFAAESAGVVSYHGFRPLLCNRPTPTPTIPNVIRSEGAICSINFTASHNPPEYKGRKLSTSERAPAPAEVNKHVEGLIAQGTQSWPQTTKAKTSAFETNSTSHLLDRVAEARGLPVYETPVDFKFIGELINEDKIILGGEESAGLSIKGHYPEKDGILARLLAAEAVAARGESLTEQLNKLYARVGRLEAGRIGVRLTDDLMKSLSGKLNQDPTEIGGRAIERTNRIDGVKFMFADGSWLLMRPSGTEPLVRIYAESESATDLEVLLEQGRKYLLG